MSPEPPSPETPSNPAPRSEDLEGLLEEIGETLGDPEAPPAPPAPGWAGWKVWTLAGALGCALAGALTAGRITGLSPTFVLDGLPAWAWGAVDGALIGSLSGPACLIWERVRRGSLRAFQGLVLIVLLSGAALALSSLLIDNLISLVKGQRLYLPPPQSVLFSFWGKVVYGCALGGGLLSHVGTRGLVGRLFFSWLLCVVAYLPFLLLGARLFPYLAEMDFFWRAGFPYYLAFPLSWWVAGRFAPDPLPVLVEGEASSDDA